MPVAYNISNVQNQAALDLRRATSAFDNFTKNLFSNQANSMVGERLRSNANEGFITLSAEAAPDDNLYLLPSDFVETRFVRQVNGDTLQNLSPIGVSVNTGLRTSASTALAYNTFSQLETGTQTLQMVLQLVPGNGQDIDVDYWQEPTPFPNNDFAATNPALQTYFQLYVWGYEIFAWQAVQNFEQRDRCQQLFDAELARINTAAAASRYGAGAARGSAARFYNNAPSRAM